MSTARQLPEPWAARLLEVPDTVDGERMWALTRHVAKAFGVRDANLIIAKGRDEPAVVIARKVAIYATRRVMHVSWPRIGRFFNRDHTTAMNANDSVSERLCRDATFAGVVYRLLLELG